MSSKRHIRRKACEGKKKFDTAQHANDAAMSYYYTFHQRMHVYNCQFCGKYHIGHPSKKALQAIRNKRATQAMKGR